MGYSCRVIREELAEAVRRAIRNLQSRGDLPAIEIPAVEIADPKFPEHGDFATSIALSWAKHVGKNPRDLAELLGTELRRDDRFETVEVAGPGFVNFRLRAEALTAHLPDVLREPDRWGCLSAERPLRLNVEFVSVNPNGPITIGSGRGAAYGDTLCRVLEAAGHTVHREYYINDGVNSEQMRLFAESVMHYYRQEVGFLSHFPDRGYRGDYVQEVAQNLPLSDPVLLERMREHARKDPHLSDARWLRLAVTELIRRDLELVPTPHRTPDEIRRYHEIHDLVQRIVGVHVQSLYDKLTQQGDPLAVATDLLEREGLELTDAPVEVFQKEAQRLMIERQRRDLAAFGVEFDTWFSEQSLHDSGAVDECLRLLVERGFADEEPLRVRLKLGRGGVVEDVLVEDQPVEDEEGAAEEGEGRTLWLRSTKFGDDMDRVLRRKNGRPTYIASDVAYHKDKFSRPPNCDVLITVLGPDHHGYIGRLRAVVAAMLGSPRDVPAPEEFTDLDARIYRSPEEKARCRAALREASERLRVVIFQLVRFLKDGQPAPMRKRDGNIYALVDLVNEIGTAVDPLAPIQERQRIGRDVARFFYLMRSHDTAMDFDIDLAAKQSDENPVYYVQYAHARICALLRKAEEEGFSVPSPAEAAPIVRDALRDPRELALLKKILDLPHEVRRCADDFGVHRLTTYALELARAYHLFYDSCRVIQPEHPRLTAARLALCRAAQISLRRVLFLLGVSAPERMDRDAAAKSGA